MPKLRMTIVYEFDVMPEWYEEGATTEEMAEVERQSFVNSPAHYFQLETTMPEMVRVEVVEEERATYERLRAKFEEKE